MQNTSRDLLGAVDLTGVTLLAIRASRRTASFTAGIGFFTARRGTPIVRLLDSSSHLAATRHFPVNSNRRHYFTAAFFSNLPSERDRYQHWRVNTRQQCPFGSAAVEEQRTMLLHKMLEVLLLEQHAKFKIMAITSSILDRFAKFFHCCKEH